MVGRIERWFGNGWLGIVDLLITAFCVFLSLSVHEFAHGYAAYKMGDETAKNMGRLNLSPLSHIDPIGALCLFFFGFGWARPVPVNARNFKSGKMKAGMIWTSLAGPLSNLLLSFVALLLFEIVVSVGVVQSEFAMTVFSVIELLLVNLTIMNISLAVFNLLPVPPLDGSKILNAVLPARIYFKIMQYEQYGFIILILLINLPFFSGFLSTVVNGILTAFSWVIGLIPFL